MAFELPQLPYATDALEPVIDRTTMEIHHGKHHGSYVSKLNDALAGTGLESKGIEAILSDLGSVPDEKRTSVRNNGGGHYNHSLFWQIMTRPGQGGGPAGALAKAIDDDLGGFDSFKDEFAVAAAGRFGSGWAWLCVNENDRLCICSTPNQDNPIMTGLVECPGRPILGLDVWEHAYYLKYQNRRPDYIKAWFDVINWEKVGFYYESVLKQKACVCV